VIIMLQWCLMKGGLNRDRNHERYGILEIFKERTSTKPFQPLRTGGRVMKSIKFLIVIVAIGFLATACVSDGQNTGRGAVLGGILGAVAGQAIGHNTAGTLIGAGAGALSGAIIGNTYDQEQLERRIDSGYPDRPYASAPPQENVQGYPQGQYPDPPPGQWVDVPGQWVNGKWVPSHKVWVPVNPGSSYRR
jgi:hypothetical protein